MTHALHIKNATIWDGSQHISQDLFVKNGKIVAEKNLLNVNVANFDLTSLQNGVYFVKVAHANGTETIKFIKQ